MALNSCNKPISLVERKKQQWAKEKEELASLAAPWSVQDVDNFERPFQRSKNAMAHNDLFRKNIATINRRSSLPPLHKNQYNSVDREAAATGGETSGYGSDTPHRPDWQAGYESSSSCRDDRPKWRDAKFWNNRENEPPNWVKRGMQIDEEIIVTNNTSPSASPQHEEACDQERVSTACSSINRTYIRGQNIPLDSLELAERERRRQVALAHQQAVRAQLEERERARLAERAQRLRDEHAEEERVRREQEVERLRKENELRLQQLKLERDHSRKVALQAALAAAEQEARLIKHKMIGHSTNDANEANANVIRNKLEPKEGLPEKNNNVASNGRTANAEAERAAGGGAEQPPKPQFDQIQYVLVANGLNLPGGAVIEVPVLGARTENRVLTPTQLRTRARFCCDSSTQTDAVVDEQLAHVAEKLNNLEVSAFRAKSRAGERPKWGANCPPTRYVTQSEKDPLYQRRKKMHSRNSSDESQTNSPRSIRRRRGGWRRGERTYRTEVVPLQADRGRLYYKCGCCGRRGESEVVLECGRGKREDKSPRTPSVASSTRNNTEIA